MKRLLPTCFLPLAVTFTLHTGTPVIIEKPDTLTVHSTGINNVVFIDSLQRNESFYEVKSSAIKGEVIQIGENNQVEINTGGEAQNNKLERSVNPASAGEQKTNNQQFTNTKYPAPDSYRGSNQQPATINITQTGKNNSVKINSR